MANAVTWQKQGCIATVVIDNPPVNAAGQSVRAGLVDAIDALENDADVETIAVCGAGRSFVAGADIREFGKPPQAPLLPEVCNRIEACTKPVVAILHGAALGGGLELALAAHARVALPSTKLGFPEVTLGILPGAGGTQRAPRLIGVQAALDLIVTGKPINAERALALGLIDRIDTKPPLEAAIDAAQAILTGELSPRNTGSLTSEPDPNAIAKTRKAVAATARHLFAPHRCIDAIEAAELPLAEGLARERALFEQCLETPQRAGLVHAFFAERAVSKIPERDSAAQSVASVGVIGAGTMGRGIAVACLIAGYRVTLVEPDHTVRAHADTWIAETLSGAAKRGKIEDAAALGRYLTLTGSLDKVAQADLVIEAVSENMPLKQQIFATLSNQCAPHTILASNTSYLDVNALAEASGRPERVLGLHFFAPAHIMRLLEVVVAQQTAPETVATGFSVAKKLRKVAVRSGVCDGFIGNRILAATRRAADEMVLMGARPAQVDAVLEARGFAMGPYAAQDLSGLDVGAAGRAVRGEKALVADALIARNALGKKTGSGFYHYGSERVENSDLDAILKTARAQAGRFQVLLTEDEIWNRYMTAMVAEGCRILEEGIALRAIDIDAVLLFGYGFPRHLGGPMHWADRRGLGKLIAQIESYQATNQDLWSVPSLLEHRARTDAPLID